MKKSNTLSFTSVNMYNNCSLCYKLHYIDGIRPKRLKSYFIYGSAVDKGLNTLLLKNDLAKAKKAFERNWEKITKNQEIEYIKSDSDLHENPWESLKLKGLLFIETYYNEILPKIKNVVEVQKSVILKNKEGDKIKGYLDAIVEWENGEIYLIDHKTSSSKYKEDSAKTSEQLNLYNHIIRYKTKYKIDGIGFIVFLKKFKKDKTKVDYQVIINKSDTIYEDKVLEMCDNANYGISNGLFASYHNPNLGKYGKCPYHDYYEGNENFIKIERKNDRKVPNSKSSEST